MCEMCDALVVTEWRACACECFAHALASALHVCVIVCECAHHRLHGICDAPLSGTQLLEYWTACVVVLLDVCVRVSVCVCVCVCVREACVLLTRYSLYPCGCPCSRQLAADWLARFGREQGKLGAYSCFKRFHAVSCAEEAVRLRYVAAYLR